MNRAFRRKCRDYAHRRRKVKNIRSGDSKRNEILRLPRVPRENCYRKSKNGMRVFTCFAPVTPTCARVRVQTLGRGSVTFEEHCAGCELKLYLCVATAPPPPHCVRCASEKAKITLVATTRVVLDSRQLKSFFHDNTDTTGRRDRFDARSKRMCYVLYF